MTEIDWSKCPDVESVPGRCSGAPVVKDSRGIVESCILDNADAGATPEEIADWFEVPVATVREVLHFALSAEFAELMQRRYSVPRPPKWGRRNAARLDKLARQIAEIEKRGGGLWKPKP
jgi:uncharacterized protein (DUF433 family)